ncbi:MAG TPA: hypothetical protein VI997_09000, partial [Candidatus Thermoplasmatota archaeon]|nr:hypothetical protein [Candidatus Thermoplasmatota archaeon]
SAPPPPESAPPPPSPVSPPPPAPPGPVYATERAFGNITGAGASSTSACCLWLATPESNADALSTLVQAGTVAVIVELRWSDTRFDLDLRVTSPDYEEVGTPDSNATEPDPTAPQNATSNATGASPTIHKGMQWTAVDGTPGTGGGYAVVRVDDVDALRHTGEWAIDIGAKGPVVAAAYEVAITRVTVAAPPADWSAYDSE